MTYFRTHRSGHCSIPIREASFCGRWRLTETHSRTMGREWDTLRHVHKWDVFMSAMQKRRQRSIRSGGDAWLQGNSIVQGQQGWCTYDLTESTAACLRPTQVQNSKLQYGEGKWAQKFLIKKLFLMNTCLERGTVFSNGVTLSITSSRTGPNPRNSWLTKCISFSLCMLFGFFGLFFMWLVFVCLYFPFVRDKEWSRAGGENMEGTGGGKRIWTKFIV